MGHEILPNPSSTFMKLQSIKDHRMPNNSTSRIAHMTLCITALWLGAGCSPASTGYIIHLDSPGFRDALLCARSERLGDIKPVPVLYRQHPHPIVRDYLEEPHQCVNVGRFTTNSTANPFRFDSDVWIEGALKCPTTLVVLVFDEFGRWRIADQRDCDICLETDGIYHIRVRNVATLECATRSVLLGAGVTRGIGFPELPDIRTAQARLHELAPWCDGELTKSLDSRYRARISGVLDALFANDHPEAAQVVTCVLTIEDLLWRYRNIPVDSEQLARDLFEAWQEATHDSGPGASARILQFWTRFRNAAHDVVQVLLAR